MRIVGVLVPRFRGRAQGRIAHLQLRSGERALQRRKALYHDRLGRDDLQLVDQLVVSGNDRTIGIRSPGTIDMHDVSQPAQQA